MSFLWHSSNRSIATLRDDLQFSSIVEHRQDGRDYRLFRISNQLWTVPEDVLLDPLLTNDEDWSHSSMYLLVPLGVEMFLGRFQEDLFEWIESCQLCHIDKLDVGNCDIHSLHWSELTNEHIDHHHKRIHPFDKVVRHIERDLDQNTERIRDEDSVILVHHYNPDNHECHRRQIPWEYTFHCDIDILRVHHIHSILKDHNWIHPRHPNIEWFHHRSVSIPHEEHFHCKRFHRSAMSMFRLDRNPFHVETPTSTVNSSFLFRIPYWQSIPIRFSVQLQIRVLSVEVRRLEFK